MVVENCGCDLKIDWIKNVTINKYYIDQLASGIGSKRTISGDYQAAWLLKAVTLIDLTTLAGDDTASNVSRLCFKAAKPIASDLLQVLGFNYDDENCPIHTAAVCVYPAKVSDAFSTLKKLNKSSVINVAAVATGFPSGQYSLSTRLEEIKYAVKEGANEIDIVIDRALVLTGKWELLYEELKQMKAACGNGVHMKAILATGELLNYTNVYKASMIAMMAGADFIKTSTGKESINATLQFGIVMAKAIKDYERRTGVKVGLKPAGGIRTSSDALAWLVLVKEYLGDEWLSPTLFRFGASGLLSDIEYKLYEYATGKKAVPHTFTMG